MTYLFLDIETTGLNPTHDSILEIAWVFTDSEFNTVGVPRTFLVDQERWSDTWFLLNDPSNMFVRNMHTESGLLAELANDDLPKYTLDAIYQTLEEDLEDHTKTGLVHLTGRSVHFDKSFLLSEDFDRLFDDQQPVSIHHRMLDLSSVKLMLQSCGIEKQFDVENTLPHRALQDVLADIGYARNIRSFIQGVTA